MRGLLSAVVLSALAMGGLSGAAQVPASAGHTAYSIEPFTPAVPITIQGTGVRLRAEPFTTPQTQVLSSGSTGLALNVVGLARLPDWNWYQVVLKNGQKAFIRSDLTSAPSRGGQASAALPPIPVINSAPAPVTPAPVTLAPVPPAPITTPPPYSSPTYTRPATTSPVYTAPAYTPPVSAPPASSGDAPISLVPRSDLPALQPGSPVSSTSDPSGLQSVPPG